MASRRRCANFWWKRNTFVHIKCSGITHVSSFVDRYRCWWSAVKRRFWQETEKPRSMGLDRHQSYQPSDYVKSLHRLKLTCSWGPQLLQCCLGVPWERAASIARVTSRTTNRNLTRITNHIRESRGIELCAGGRQRVLLFHLTKGLPWHQFGSMMWLCSRMVLAEIESGEDTCRV